jgi:hypothetical protein
MAQEQTVKLDKEAQKLYQLIEGVEIREETSLGKALSEEEETLNATRGLLGNIAYLLSTCFRNARTFKNSATEEKFLDRFVGILNELRQVPENDRKVLIRFRGLKTGAGVSGKTDYVVLFGNMVFDMAAADSLVKNSEEFSSDFQLQLSKAFQVFADHGISNLFLQFRDESPDSLKAMRTALHILIHCSHAANPAHSEVSGKAHSLTSFRLIHDERGQADLNLTLLAGVNGVKPETMKALVRKMDAWMHSPNYAGSPEQSSSVYNAILGVEKLRKKLTPPPIEVNNIKWLMVDDEYEAVTKEKTEVARVVTDQFGNSPRETAGIMVSVYGDDYQQINSQNLGERLRLASNLLTSIDKTKAGKPVMEEVLENVEKRLDQATDEAYDSLEIDGGVIKAKDGDEETAIGKIHSTLKGMVGFFKARSAIKKKMKSLAERGIQFDENEYRVIAKDFDITTNEAKKLIETFKICFDENGVFLREAFARNIPAFAEYKKKILEFLWQYLKQMTRREDRVALLNSLQILIPQLKQPQRILRTLLADFIRDPASLAVSDQSALVLLTLLMSNYSKERTDIEITPEEVLKITVGLNTRVIAGARRLLDVNQERFFKKVRTIHRKLAEVLDAGQPEESPMSLRDIFLLEREVYIFLSLVGGTTARALLRGAVRVYGNPAGELYLLDESERFMPYLLQVLKIASRGLGRVGQRKDMGLLDEVRTRHKDFLEIIAEKSQEELVRRAMEIVRISMQRIVSRQPKQSHH